MVDERALDAACREFKEHLYFPGTTSDDERTAIKAAIEAYEAAKNAAQGAGDARQAAREDKSGAS